MAKRLKVMWALRGSEKWLELVKKMKTDYGWEPHYILSRRLIFHSVQAAFPDSMKHWEDDQKMTIPPEGFPQLSHYPFDEEMHKRYSRYEGLVLKNMDRLDPGGNLFLEDRINY